MINYQRRAGKVPLHVWLPADLLEKINAENERANKSLPWYSRESKQTTIERILLAGLAPAKKAKKK